LPEVVQAAEVMVVAVVVLVVIAHLLVHQAVGLPQNPN
jgi:hypothetical protein